MSAHEAKRGRAARHARRISDASKKGVHLISHSLGAMGHGNRAQVRDAIFGRVGERFDQRVGCVASGGALTE